MRKLFGGLAICAIACAANPAFAERTTPEAFRIESHRVTAQYKEERAACAALKGTALEICRTEAKAKRSIAMAEAEASFKDTERARAQVHRVRAAQASKVARAKCGDQTGAARRDCRRLAKAAARKA